MATTARKPAVRKSATATKADTLNKAAPKRGTTYLPGTAIPADLKPVKRGAVKKDTTAHLLASPANAEHLKKSIKQARSMATSTTSKVATKPLLTKRAAPVPHASMKAVKVAKAKKPSTAVKFKGFLIPVTRKNGTDGLDVPTIQLNKVSDISKLFALLPKGCTVDTFSTQQINLFNKSGALIAEIRTNK